MAKKKKPKLPRSTLARTTRLLGAGAMILTREVGSRVNQKISKVKESKLLKTKIQQAQDLVRALENLKGAAMKAGQLLSLEFSDILPPEVVTILRKLHDDTSFLPFSEIESILRSELGEERYQELSDITPEPIAAASIGQVHAATLRGQRVVLKVQYPGIAESIDTDLKVLKSIVTSFLRLKNKSIKLDDVFEELRDSLVLEVDYLQEVAFLEKYRSVFSKYDAYIVPEPYKDFCTHKILTMSYQDGERLKTYIQHASLDKDRFASVILDLLFLEFFEEGLVQTDPNYGNFLWSHEQEKLVLLDFGATKTFKPEFREGVRSLLRAALAKDHGELVAVALALGFLDPRESPEVQEYFYKFMLAIVRVFEPEQQPFDFSDLDYLQEMRDMSMGFVDLVQFTAPAKHMIFLNRKLGGMYHLLKDVGCKKDLHAYWENLDKVVLTD